MRWMVLCVWMPACASQGHQAAFYVTLPSGEQGIVVKCGRDITVCWALASNSCPTGYEVVQTDTGSGFEAGAANGMALAHSTRDHAMMIRCKTESEDE